MEAPGGASASLPRPARRAPPARPPPHRRPPTHPPPQLASNADLYVNDAFGTAHRAHASTEGVTKFLKPSVSGFLLQKELDYLDGAVSKPKRPFCAIVGGSKVSSKITVIESLLDKVDKLIIGWVAFAGGLGGGAGVGGLGGGAGGGFGGVEGSEQVAVAKQAALRAEEGARRHVFRALTGSPYLPPGSGGMVFTFYKARGFKVGSSLVEEDKLELAKKLEEMAKQKVGAPRLLGPMMGAARTVAGARLWSPPTACGAPSPLPPLSSSASP
jgi:hypothetical protein